jgi:iron complex transport system substrate-binding protein
MLRRQFLKGCSVSAISLLLSCGKTNNQDDRILKIANSNCRIFEQGKEKICVPANPQRIIALDDSVILDPLIALGIKPIGCTSYWTEKDISFRGLSEQETMGIELVGSILEPSLEKILRLKPDLILARESFQPFDLLSKIAPTVIIDRSRHEKSFKDNFLFVANAVNKTKQAEAVLANYTQRVNELRDRLEDVLESIKVSVIGYNYSGSDSFFVCNLDVIYHQVLTDIGIRRMPIVEEQKEYCLTLSIESIDQYDADVLIVVNYSKAPLESYLKHPLWAALNSVKSRRIYEVKPDVWATFGPMGVNRILDDLYKHLVIAS